MFWETAGAKILAWAPISATPQTAGMSCSAKERGGVGSFLLELGSLALPVL
jgi:hypothetical protein